MNISVRTTTIGHVTIYSHTMPVTLIVPDGEPVTINQRLSTVTFGTTSEYLNKLLTKRSYTTDKPLLTDKKFQCNIGEEKIDVVVTPNCATFHFASSSPINIPYDDLTEDLHDTLIAINRSSKVFDLSSHIRDNVNINCIYIDEVNLLIGFAVLFHVSHPLYNKISNTFRINIVRRCNRNYNDSYDTYINALFEVTSRFEKRDSGIYYCNNDDGELYSYERLRDMDNILRRLMLELMNPIKSADTLIN